MFERDRSDHADVGDALPRHPPRRLLRKPAVLALRGGISAAKLYADCAAKAWVPPVKLGAGRASGWPEDECSQLQAAYIAGVSADRIRALVEKLTSLRAKAAA
jgi:predicted DNA-binding transcriptional regulator AlpA